MKELKTTVNVEVEEALVLFIPIDSLQIIK
jgi:hypothetical protein